MARKYIDCREFRTKRTAHWRFPGPNRRLNAAVIQAVSVMVTRRAGVAEQLRGLLKDAPETGLRPPEPGLLRRQAVALVRDKPQQECVLCLGSSDFIPALSMHRKDFEQWPVFGR